MKSFLSFAIIFSLMLSFSAFAASSPQGKKDSISSAKEKAVVQIEPAAVDLLDRAIAAYKASDGIRMEFESSGSVSRGTAIKNHVMLPQSTTLYWRAPNLLRIEKTVSKTSLLVISDGKFLYATDGGKTFRRTSLAEKRSGHAAGFAASMGQGFYAILPSLLLGKNLLTNSKNNTPMLRGYHASLRVLPSTMIDGRFCDGLRWTEQFSYNSQAFFQESTAWFDKADFLLRRAQLILQQPGMRTVNVEKITSIEISPQFTAGTFVWTPPVGAEEIVEVDTVAHWRTRQKAGQAPYELVGKDLKGNAIPLRKYRGKVVLIDFWATWCGPCLQELPGLVSSYKKYHSKGFEVIGISLDGNKTELTKFLGARKIHWPQLYDGKMWNGENVKRYKVQGIPFMLLIGKDGKIAAVNPRGPALEAAVKAALAR